MIQIQFLVAHISAHKTTGVKAGGGGEKCRQAKSLEKKKEEDQGYT